MSKINLNDSVLTILEKMSEGNPGAATVLVRIVKEGAEIDPQSFAGELTGILSLDTYGIYGSKIWMLYKDVCGHSLVDMLALLRACQLGKLPVATLLHAIENRGAGLDVFKVSKEVREELKDFGKKVN